MFQVVNDSQWGVKSPQGRSIARAPKSWGPTFSLRDDLSLDRLLWDSELFWTYCILLLTFCPARVLWGFCGAAGWLGIIFQYFQYGPKWNCKAPKDLGRRSWNPKQWLIPSHYITLDLWYVCYCYCARFLQPQMFAGEPAEVQYIISFCLLPLPPTPASRQGFN